MSAAEIPSHLTADDHNSACLLKALFDKKLFSDLALKVGDEIFSVHRSIMFLVSPYFQNMLTMETADKYKDVIELKDIDILGFKLVLNYIYSGKMDLTYDNVYNVISVANYFQMTCLKSKCVQFLEKAISSSTAVDIFQAAVLYDVEDLKVTAKGQLIRNNAPVNLNKLSYLCMKCLVSTPYEGGDKVEEIIFSAIQLWLRHDQANRQKHATELLQMLQFEALSAATLKTALSDKIIQDCPSIVSKIATVSVTRLELSEHLTNITQKVVWVDDNEKVKFLLDLLSASSITADSRSNTLTIIFTKTKKRAHHLNAYLNDREYKSTLIHDDQTELERREATDGFRSGEYPILVATTSAARGLDITNIRHVMNFDLPNNINEYLLRIKCTGRCGSLGLTTAFFNHGNQNIVIDLVVLLIQTKQEVPQWLKAMAAVSPQQENLNRGTPNFF